MSPGIKSKFNLKGKVALVTGGSRGIGRAIALGLAEAGADIILASRKLPDLEAVASEITQKGRKALPVPANLRQLPDIEALVKRAVDELGHIDILVNNAATNPVFGSVLDVEEKAWDVTLELNLKGYFFTAQSVAKLMRKQGGGNIVNIASVDGIRPRLGTGIYGISKAGVLMLTQVLAQELGKYHIRVNAIAPGVIKTRLSTALWENPVIRDTTLDSSALGRIGEVGDLVGAALYLASDASDYVTGQTIVVDGGYFGSLETLRPTIAEPKE
ncbi:MAG: glucose 1-dehydrogenase [Chloroflexota bacterium]